MTKTEDGKLPGRCHLLRNGRNLQGQGLPRPVTVTGEGGRGSGEAVPGGAGGEAGTNPLPLQSCAGCRCGHTPPRSGTTCTAGSKCHKHPSPQLSHIHLSQRCSSLPLLSSLSAYVRAKVNYNENTKKLFPGCDVIFAAFLLLSCPPET